MANRKITELPQLLELNENDLNLLIIETNSGTRAIPYEKLIKRLKDKIEDANIDNDVANNAYATANNAYAKANNAYNQAFRTDASSALGIANNAYANATNAYATANNAYNTANNACFHANAANNNAFSAWNAANLASTNATLAYATANNAYNLANSASTNATNAYATANNAYAKANNAYNQAFRTDASSAYGMATNAYATANNAYNLASSAYSKATAVSDYRDKMDITPIEENAIEFLRKIKTVRYVLNLRDKYIDEEKLTDEEKTIKEKYNIYKYDKEAHAKGTKKENRVQIGVLAQQVLETMANVYGDTNYANLVDDNLYNVDLKEVPEGVENRFTVNYERFIPLLIKALQELVDRTDSIDDRVTALEIQ